MGKHRLPEGSAAINFLGRIGSALGYEVRFEYPLSLDSDSKERSDVAWLVDKEQAFPLFLFEVESTTTNSMSYNALKVFSKPSQDFLKPLFLFHVVVSGAQDSAVAKSLSQEYGRSNYRLFNLQGGGWVPIVCSVLEQHRRVSLSIDLDRMIESLIAFGWQKDAIERVVSHSETLLFRKTAHLFPRVLAKYSIQDNSLLGIYVSCIEGEMRKRPKWGNSDYGTYFGNEWSYPIHLGILAATNLADAPALFEKLKIWQMNPGSFTIIGAHFGLSRDYDLFLIWLSGLLVAVLAALFRTVEGSVEYFAGVLLPVIKRTAGSWRLPNLIWLYHIVSRISESETAYFVEKELHGLGALSSEVLLHLPRGVIDDDEWLERVEGLLESAQHSDPRQVRAACKSSAEASNPADARMLAIRLLLANDPLGLPFEGLLRSLY